MGLDARRGSIALLAAFLLTFTFLTFPPAPPDQQSGYEADAALSAILNYAHQHQLQFGTGLAYTYGPAGYLIFFYFFPATAEWHMLTDLLLCFTVALGLCLLAWRLRPIWRWLLLAAFAWGGANLYPRTDVVLNVCLLCWGLLCVIENGRRLRWALGVFSLLAAFCALAKVSYLFVSGWSVVAIGLTLLLRGKPRAAAAVLVGVPATFLLGWWLAGQALANVPAYLTHAVAMATGYNAALGWEEPAVATHCGLLLAALLLAALVLRLLEQTKQAGTGPALIRWVTFAWLFGLAFTVYKHGFVRGMPEDLSVCFLFFALLGPVLMLFEPAQRGLRRWAGVVAFATWVVALAPIQVLSVPDALASLRRPLFAFLQNVGWAFRPGEYLRTQREVFQTNRRGAALAELGSMAGNRRVDVFGRRQFYAVLNDLNYAPRPVPQSYAACNAALMKLNEDYYLSHAAPEYVLFQLDTFDRKFPPLEDAWLLRDLLINYQPVAAENQCLLLKSRGRELPKPVLMRAGTVHPGEPIELGALGQTNLWLEITLKPSWTGWVRQLLYRPPVVRLAAWREPHKPLVRRRAPASMLAAGFLASPLVLNNDDVSALYRANARVCPCAYSVELRPGEEGFWKKQIQFRVYALRNQLGWRGEVSSTPAPSGSAAASKALPFSVFHARAWRSGVGPGDAGDMLSFALFVLVPCASGALLLVLALKRRGMAGRPTGWWQLAAGNLLVFLFLTSAVFLAAETYFRFIYDTTDSLGFTKVCERWVQRHWQVNAAGCRDDVDYSAAMRPGQRRITFIGDSFAAGHGISNVEDRFANRLRRAHPDWDIQVLANVGLDTGAEQVLLNRVLHQGYQLDQVVLVYCLNDVGDLMPEQTGIYDQLLENQGGWLCRHSYCLNLLFNRYRASRIPLLRNYFPYVREAYRGPLWERQKLRLKAFRDTVAAHGGHLAVVTFPFFDVLGPHYPFESVHQQLDDFWRSLDVPHLDLLGVYGGYTPEQLTVNRYDAHPNELANRLAADALNAFLSP